jgi:hypothetical protein
VLKAIKDEFAFMYYDNPKHFESTCGFDEEKELKLEDMLRFKDVHKG